MSDRGDVAWFYTRWFIGMLLNVIGFVAALTWAGVGFRLARNPAEGALLAFGGFSAGMAGARWLNLHYVVHCLPEVIGELRNTNRK